MLEFLKATAGVFSLVVSLIALFQPSVLWNTLGSGSGEALFAAWKNPFALKSILRHADAFIALQADHIIPAIIRGATSSGRPYIFDNSTYPTNITALTFTKASFPNIPILHNVTYPATLSGFNNAAPDEIVLDSATWYGYLAVGFIMSLALAYLTYSNTSFRTTFSRIDHIFSKLFKITGGSDPDYGKLLRDFLQTAEHQGWIPDPYKLDFMSHVNLIIGLDDHVKLLTFRNDDLQDLCDRQPEQVEHPRDERKNAADLHAQQLNEANARHEKLQETLQSTVILNRLNNLLACERHSQQTKCLVDEHQRATDLHSYQLCKEKSRTEKLKTRLAEAGLSLLDLKALKNLPFPEPDDDELVDHAELRHRLAAANTIIAQQDQEIIDGRQTNSELQTAKKTIAEQGQEVEQGRRAASELEVARHTIAKQCREVEEAHQAKSDLVCARNWIAQRDERIEELGRSLASASAANSTIPESSAPTVSEQLSPGSSVPPSDSPLATVRDAPLSSPTDFNEQREQVRKQMIGAQLLAKDAWMQAPANMPVVHHQSNGTTGSESGQILSAYDSQPALARLHIGPGPINPESHGDSDSIPLGNTIDTSPKPAQGIAATSHKADIATEDPSELGFNSSDVGSEPSTEPIEEPKTGGVKRDRKKEYQAKKNKERKAAKTAAKAKENEAAGDDNSTNTDEDLIDLGVNGPDTKVGNDGLLKNPSQSEEPDQIQTTGPSDQSTPTIIPAAPGPAAEPRLAPTRRSSAGPDQAPGQVQGQFSSAPPSRIRNLSSAFSDALEPIPTTGEETGDSTDVEDSGGLDHNDVVPNRQTDDEGQDKEMKVSMKKKRRRTRAQVMASRIQRQQQQQRQLDQLGQDQVQPTAIHGSPSASILDSALSPIHSSTSGLDGGPSSAPAYFPSLTPDSTPTPSSEPSASQEIPSGESCQPLPSEEAEAERGEKKQVEEPKGKNYEKNCKLREAKKEKKRTAKAEKAHEEAESAMDMREKCTQEKPAPVSTEEDPISFFEPASPSTGATSTSKHRGRSTSTPSLVPLSQQQQPLRSRSASSPAPTPLSPSIPNVKLSPPVETPVHDSSGPTPSARYASVSDQNPASTPPPSSSSVGEEAPSTPVPNQSDPTPTPEPASEAVPAAAAFTQSPLPSSRHNGGQETHGQNHGEHRGGARRPRFIPLVGWLADEEKEKAEKAEKEKVEKEKAEKEKAEKEKKTAVAPPAPPNEKQTPNGASTADPISPTPAPTPTDDSRATGLSQDFPKSELNQGLSDTTPSAQPAPQGNDAANAPRPTSNLEQPASTDPRPAADANQSQSQPGVQPASSQKPFEQPQLPSGRKKNQRRRGQGNRQRNHEREQRW